jgi:hypothetical protein
MKTGVLAIEEKKLRSHNHNENMFSGVGETFTCSLSPETFSPSMVGFPCIPPSRSMVNSLTATYLTPSTSKCDPKSKSLLNYFPNAKCLSVRTLVNTDEKLSCSCPSNVSKHIH